MKKKIEKSSESEKLINSILKDKNTKAMSYLEKILRKKIANRINSTLNDK